MAQAEEISALWTRAGLFLTQRVCDACLHVVCADVADAVLVFWLGQYNNPDVPEGMDCYLQGRQG